MCLRFRLTEAKEFDFYEKPIKIFRIAVTGQVFFLKLTLAKQKTTRNGTSKLMPLGA
jgi:hypothetical protein